jgi:hypothetical protein
MAPMLNIIRTRMNSPMSFPLENTRGNTRSPAGEHGFPLDRLKIRQSRLKNNHAAALHRFLILSAELALAFEFS